MSSAKLSTVKAIAFAISVFVCSPLQAAVTPESVAKQPDILVLIDQPSQKTQDFTPLIAEAASYKLGNLGLASQVVTAAPPEADSPLPRIRASGASAALVCRYQVDGGQMVFSLTWFDVQSDTSVAVQTRGPVDLHLDEVILAALDEILGRVDTRVSALSARRASMNAPVAPPTAVPTLPPAQGPSQVIGQHAAATPAPHRFLLSGGFAPFVPIGAASYYFSLGYLPSVLATVFLDTPVGPVGIGLYSGMDYFAAAGTLATSINYLIPIGLDLRYEIGGGGLRPYFHLVGGPALLVMVTSTQGTLVDVLPFLKTGIGLEIDIGSRFGVSALVDYDAYFEMPYLLTGFSPSVNMVFHP
jgi:hypothetical protein